MKCFQDRGDKTSVKYFRVCILLSTYLIPISAMVKGSGNVTKLWLRLYWQNVKSMLYFPHCCSSCSIDSINVFRVFTSGGDKYWFDLIWFDLIWFTYNVIDNILVIYVNIRLILVRLLITFTNLYTYVYYVTKRDECEGQSHRSMNRCEYCPETHAIYLWQPNICMLSSKMSVTCAIFVTSHCNIYPNIFTAIAKCYIQAVHL